MKQYVDAFVIPMPKKNVAKYKAMAAKCGKIWMKYGALQYVETVVDLTEKPVMCPGLMQLPILKKDDVVVFSYIMYKSKAHRTKVNKLVMADPVMQKLCAGPLAIFDSKRMYFSGCETIVNLDQ